MIQEKGLSGVFQTEFGWEGGFQDSSNVTKIVNAEFYSRLGKNYFVVKYPMFMIANPVKKNPENPELARFHKNYLFSHYIRDVRWHVNQVKTDGKEIHDDKVRIYVMGLGFEKRVIDLVRIPDSAIINDPTGGKRPPFIVLDMEILMARNFVAKFDHILDGFGNALDNFKKGIGYP